MVNSTPCVRAAGTVLSGKYSATADNRTNTSVDCHRRSRSGNVGDGVQNNRSVDENVTARSPGALRCSRTRLKSTTRGRVPDGTPTIPTVTGPRTRRRSPRARTPTADEARRRRPAAARSLRQKYRALTVTTASAADDCPSVRPTAERGMTAVFRPHDFRPRPVVLAELRHAGRHAAQLDVQVANATAVAGRRAHVDGVDRPRALCGTCRGDGRVGESRKSRPRG